MIIASTTTYQMFVAVLDSGWYHMCVYRHPIVSPFIALVFHKNASKVDTIAQFPVSFKLIFSWNINPSISDFSSALKNPK